MSEVKGKIKYNKFPNKYEPLSTNKWNNIMFGTESNEYPAQNHE